MIDFDSFMLGLVAGFDLALALIALAIWCNKHFGWE